MSAAKREEEAGLAVAMGISSRFTQSLSPNATWSKGVQGLVVGPQLGGWILCIL